IVVGLVFYVLWQRATEDSLTGVSSPATVDRALLAASTGPGSLSTVSQAPQTAAESKPTPQAAAEAVVELAGVSSAGWSADKAPSVGEAAGQLVLQAAAVEDTWLRVEIDGDKRQDMLLASGKSVRWEAKERFVLTIGNGRGTRLALNGKDIQLPATRGNVIRDFLVTRALLY